MTDSQVTEILSPYTAGLRLAPDGYGQIGAYLDLLLRWNAKTNLTAVRAPEQIVARHFGESLFAAQVLFGTAPPREGVSLADVGSGAGFPGLPIKVAIPQLDVTLLESHNKKATFLREVIRALKLEGVQVYSGRAERWPSKAEVVTMRAVENFQSILPTAADLVAPSGRVCLLIGQEQVATAQQALGARFSFGPAHPIPASDSRVVLVGSSQSR